MTIRSFGDTILKEPYISLGIGDGSHGKNVTIWFNNIIENQEDRDLYGEPGTYAVFDKNTENEKHDMAFYKIVKRGTGVKYKIIPNGKTITLTERNNGNGQTYTDNKLKIQIINPFAPEEGKEDQRNIELAIKGTIYPVKKDLSNFGSEYYTAIGDATSCKNGSATDEHDVANAFRDKGYTIEFDDFWVEFMENNYTDVMHRRDFIHLKFVFDKINPDVDSEFKIYLRGRNKSVHFATVEYKLKTWFDETAKVKSNLREVYGTTTVGDANYWRTQFRKIIYGARNSNEGNLFEITEENFTNFDDGNYKKFGTISSDRIRTKTGMEEQKMTFKVTALRDGEFTQYLGTGQDTFSVKKGEEYEVTLENAYWLVQDNAFYFNDVWIKTKNAEGNAVEDLEGQQNLQNTTNAGTTAFIELAGVMLGSQRQPTIFEGVVDHIDKYIPTGDIDPADETQLLGKVNVVLSTTVDIGIVIAVIMIAVIGIKYMLGSAEEKAEYKKTLVPYVVGVIMLLGITTIVKILQTLGENINNI